MTIHIPQSHDKLFKVSLTEKPVAIDYLKSHVPVEIYKRININTLELTDKSFILPKFREIHSDIVYRHLIQTHSMTISALTILIWQRKLFLNLCY